MSNVAHQPEGGGAPDNLINLILSNFEEGGGFLIYELRCTSANSDSGIYRYAPDLSNWVERDGTQEIWKGKLENKTSDIALFNHTINKADQKIAVAVKGRCAAFNVDNHSGNWTEDRTIGFQNTVLSDMERRACVRS